MQNDRVSCRFVICYHVCLCGTLRDFHEIRYELNFIELHLLCVKHSSRRSALKPFVGFS